MLSLALQRVRQLGFESIRSRLDSEEQTAHLRMKDSNQRMQPDITAEKHGGKHYFEVATREDDPGQTLQKWLLLSRLAELKGGVFRIFVPKGSMRYTQSLMRKGKIRGEVIKLD